MESLDSAVELSYDDTISYADQIATTVIPNSESALDIPDESFSELPSSSSLADRIGKGKLYLLSDVTASLGSSRANKRKRGDGEADIDEEPISQGLEESMDADSGVRSNAILLEGSPISQLPTARIFAYATHFDTNPIGLEWVSDTTCVLVFPSPSSARSAYASLQKFKGPTDPLPASEQERGFVTAKNIPMAFWPAEERINASLGKSEGLKGTVMMRWARLDDVKQRGAKEQSQFYKKYGMDAGKEAEKRKKDLEERMSLRPGLENKRRRVGTEDEKRAELDRELEGFLKEESDEEPQRPRSKMRSDYPDGELPGTKKTLLERTSVLRSHSSSLPLADRIIARLPRRARQDSPAERSHESNRKVLPPKKTQQELDDELDAFLHERD